MMNRIRDSVRDLLTPGGLRRHPILAAAALLVIVIVVFGLILRPL